ncbi:MAG: AbrB/MazE/SpoVT family DNA-binding domain-containing protein [Clostridia bacterium]|nr:AbrB/MazE/SpoVT family DNA-binding domain-containing protein [Clostridia bacterium]
MLKSTGMVRKIDELGRVVLPIEIRNTLGIESRDSLEIFVEGDKIVLGKYQPACLFCGNAQNVIYFHGKLICHDCLDQLKKQF